jgi:hypothetical protein
MSQNGKWRRRLYERDDRDKNERRKIMLVYHGSLTGYG